VVTYAKYGMGDFLYVSCDAREFTSIYLVSWV
jgi:hypothetical protein